MVSRARVSDFSHKSLNASEDSKVFINPLKNCERAMTLKNWYDDIQTQPEKMDFHPLSGQLNVETHGHQFNENPNEVNIAKFLKQ